METDMCKIYSCVIANRGKTLYDSIKTASHTEIIREHQLNKDGTRGPNIVKIEITPPGDDYELPLDQWNYRVDQDVVPEWYDPQACEQLARSGLVRWAKTCIIRDDRQIVDHLAIVLNGGTVEDVRSGGTIQCIISGGTVKDVSSGGTVQNVEFGGTVQNVESGGTVERVSHGGTVERVASGGTVQHVEYGGTVERVWSGGTVQRVESGGTVKVCSGVICRMYSDNDTALKGPYAVVIDCRGNRAVCITADTI